MQPLPPAAKPGLLIKIRELPWKDDNLSPCTSHVLDVTRALAACLVVLMHARINALGVDPGRKFDQLLYAVTNCGSGAVDWFFVISGYLVGGSVIAEVARTCHFDFRRYLINRMARLYVVLLPALAVGAILDGVRIAKWGINAHAGFETAQSFSSTTLIGNVFYLQTLLVPTFGSNGALWSLANEFWYYVLFPLLLAPLMINRHPALRLILVSAGLVILTFICSHNISMAWLFTLWCLGAIIRFLPIKRMKSQALAWTLAVAAMIALPHLHPLIGLLSTLLVAVTFSNALVTSHGRKAVLSGRWLGLVKWLSGFSFSLYLIHLPVQHLIATSISQHSDPFLYLPPRSLAAPAMIGLLACSSYVAAVAFSMLTEAHTGSIRRWLLVCIPRAMPSR